MLRLEGSIKGLKINVGPVGVNRQVTFEIGSDADLDALQTIMQQRQRLEIQINKIQLELGDELEEKFQGRKGVPA